MAILETGTAANQIPTNGDLGELAFQSKESVNFTGGRAGLHHLDVAAINRQLNINAVDIFVYDTSKDSDGGAWRKRCQHLSWYNETLNTSTRGSRREFPAVAVIVAESSGVSIYDGDDPTLPMWMRFNNDGVVSWATAGTAYASAVCAVNGIVVIGIGAGSGGGTIHCDFAKDDMRLGYNSTAYFLKQRSIQYRNALRSVVGNLYYTGGDGYILVYYSVTALAITVLPNAPLDSVSGLPVPTTAIATSLGMSVINFDGTVSSNALNSDASQGGSIASTAFDKSGVLYIGQYHRSSTFGANMKYSTYPYTTYTTIYGWGGYVGAPYLASYVFGGGNESVRFIKSNPNGDIYTGFNYTALGISAIAHNAVDRSKSMVANIKSSHNTGWMPGDIKGAWLSDIIQEIAVGTELIVNGDMSSSTGWTTSLNSSTGGSITFTGGQLVMTQGSNSVWLLAGQGVTTIPGKTYTVSFQIVSSNTNANWRIYVGTSLDNNSVATYGYPTTLPAGTYFYSFVATATTTWVTIEQGGGATVAGTIDNLSVKLGDADRSVNNKGLQIYGNITKTPVSTGSDLVGYSGFSASNYLYQPYNSLLDFGTGDFSVSGWINVTSSSAVRVIYHRRPLASNINSVEIGLNTDGTLYFYTADGSTNTSTPLTGYAVQTGVWLHFCAVRQGSTLSLYVNGLLLSSGTGTVRDVSNSSAVLNIGLYQGGTYPWNGSLALIRSSATAPSVDQIKKMYNDERELFQDNAKAVLYGTSDSVTALGYDEDTGLLHVGTSSGRSVFNGLRRVDNTTVAVATSISAANGLVAEQ